MIITIGETGGETKNIILFLQTKTRRVLIRITIGETDGETKNIILFLQTKTRRVLIRITIGETDGKNQTKYLTNPERVE